MLQKRPTEEWDTGSRLTTLVLAVLPDERTAEGLLVEEDLAVVPPLFTLGALFEVVDRLDEELPGLVEVTVPADGRLEPLPCLLTEEPDWGLVEVPEERWVLLPVADEDPVLEVELPPFLSSWKVTVEEPVLDVEEEPVFETEEEEEEPVLETGEELVRLVDEELPDVPTVTEGLVVEEEVPEWVVEEPLTLEDVEDEPLTEADPPVVVLGAAGVVLFTVEEDLDELLLLEDEFLDAEEDVDFDDELPLRSCA